MEKKSSNTELNDLVAFAKRRGFVYPSSEIYGGMAGVYDYGPYGTELANNIKKLWWKEMVQKNENIVGLDSSIFANPKVWDASGHTSGFSDPIVECGKCKSKFRADHLLEDIGVVADEKMSEEELNNLFKENADKLVCPSCKAKDFSDVRNVNLLVKSNLGNFTGDSEDTYLRGETCQGIYINFKNVLDTNRVRVPFGIAQIGKAFRNEIAPRQYIFRKREFEQMEMQMFISPEEEMKLYEDWRERRWNFYTEVLGFKTENLKWHEHENLVFYAKAAWDIEYNFPFGFKELEGIHARGDYDLTQHQKHSDVSMVYKDPVSEEEYVPHVVETSVGVERMFLAVLSEFYDVDEVGGESRTVLRLPSALSPVKVAVFPLLKNKPELVAKAHEVFKILSADLMCEFDDNGNIGKRYRRQDEIGTSYCVTIDFDTLENDTVTLRDRDTAEQKRVSIKDLRDSINI